MGGSSIDGYSVALVLSSFTLNALSTGISYAYGIFYVIFLEVYQEGSTVTSWIGSINYAVECGIGPLVSLIAARIGLRATGIIGGIISFIGLLMSVFATNIHVIIVSLGLITGIGFGFCWTTTTVMVALHFDEHRSLALIIAQSGIGIGACAYPLLSKLLLDIYGWRGTMLITAAFSLHMAAASGVIRTKVPKMKKSDGNQTDGSFMGMWRNWKYLALHLHSFLFFLGVISFVTHISSYSSESGNSESLSVGLISIHGLSGLPSRAILSLPLTLKRVKACNLLAVTVIIPAACHFIIATWTSYEVMLVATILHSFVYCAMGPPFVESAMTILTPQRFTMGYGFLEVSMGLGALAGPPSAGFLRDLTGNYVSSFCLSGSALALSAMCALVLNFKTKEERTHEPIVQCDIIAELTT